MGIENYRKFRQLEALLAEQAELHGVALVAGEASRLLADHLSAVASQLRVTERTALERYLSDDLIIQLARTLGEHAVSYNEIVTAAEPVRIELASMIRVLAAVGMALKLAVGHIEQTKAESAAMLTDGADAVVTIAAAINEADGTPKIELGGQGLVWTRSILRNAIELLRSGSWECPCPSTHDSESACRLVPDLTRDLTLVGGWPSPDES